MLDALGGGEELRALGEAPVALPVRGDEFHERGAAVLGLSLRDDGASGIAQEREGAVIFDGFDAHDSWLSGGITEQDRPLT